MAGTCCQLPNDYWVNSKLNINIIVDVNNIVMIIQFRDYDSITLMGRSIIQYNMSGLFYLADNNPHLE